MVALRVDVAHAAPQARLQVLGVVPEQVHDHAPADAREDGPGVVAHGRADGLPGDHGQRERVGLVAVVVVVAPGDGGGLDGQPRQGQDDAREDVDDDLLVDAGDLARGAGAPAEDEVAAQEARDQGVVGPLLGVARGGGVGAVVFEEEAGEFVDGGELGEVAGVGAGRAEDEPELLSESVLWFFVLVVFSFPFFFSLSLPLFFLTSW